MMWDVLKSEYVKKKKKNLILKQTGIFGPVDVYAFFIYQIIYQSWKKIN